MAERIWIATESQLRLVARKDKRGHMIAVKRTIVVQTAVASRNSAVFQGELPRSRAPCRAHHKHWQCSQDRSYRPNNYQHEHGSQAVHIYAPSSLCASGY
jgi:hypothetical protein